MISKTETSGLSSRASCNHANWWTYQQGCYLSMMLRDYTIPFFILLARLFLSIHPSYSIIPYIISIPYIFYTVLVSTIYGEYSNLSFPLCLDVSIGLDIIMSLDIVSEPASFWASDASGCVSARSNDRNPEISWMLIPFPNNWNSLIARSASWEWRIWGGTFLVPIIPYM